MGLRGYSARWSEAYVASESRWRSDVSGELHGIRERYPVGRRIEATLRGLDIVGGDSRKRQIVIEALGKKGRLMRHWYVYHSEETMGRRYGRPELKRVFSTKNRTKLCLNDRIWVVEGVGQSPKAYLLAASFIYTDTHYPPFPYAKFGCVDGDFEYAYSGPGESFDDGIPLDPEALPWFAGLHAKYITKQKFFEDITGQPAIVEGLQALLASGRSQVRAAVEERGN